MGSADQETNTEATLPAGYSVRAATLDDATLVAQLRTAYGQDEGDPTVILAEEQINDWQGENLAEDSVLVFAPDGSLAGQTDILNRHYVQVSAYGGVHPDYRHRGLGTYLTRWAEEWIRARMEHAPADAQIIAQHYVNSNNEAASALIESLGYHYAHTIFVMRIEMETPPLVPEPITGFRIREFVPGQDERATFDAVEEAFHDIRGRPESTFDWWLLHTERERQTPELWYLAEDAQSGEIIGTCLGQAIPGGGGWIGGVGVRRPWRRRGVALAMLHTVFGAFYRQGIHDVQLSVDSGSPSNAPQLYTRAGMSVWQRVSLYRKVMRPGRDYSTLPEMVGE